MKNLFSLQQNSRTGDLDTNLISRQHQLNLMADFMRIKYENPTLKQYEMANQLAYSSLTLQTYRIDINVLSPYRIQPKNTIKRRKKALSTNIDNNSHRENDLKGPQMTSNHLVKAQTNTKSNKRTKLKGSDPLLVEMLAETLQNKLFHLIE